MTKSITITKKMIDDAAFELVRGEGIESLSARNIARRLGCSTQPIYNTYGSMDAIRTATMTRLENFVRDIIMTHKKTGRSFLDSGLGYIHFAKTEKVLFHGFELKVASEQDEKCDIGNPQIRALMDEDEGIQKYNLSKEGKDNVFKKIMIFTYGIAVLSYLGKLHMSETEVVAMLDDICESYLEQETLEKKGRMTK